jgi:omega-hydroxy-beta-dihydromenaquinone-9 sulfotransferase
MLDSPSPHHPSAKPPVLIWAGMGLGSWFRLLAANRFAIDRGYRALALRTTLGCSVSSVLGWVQQLRHGRAIARTSLTAPPLFVLGQPRSGTTHLHNLLCLDPRHIYPTTYSCFFPRHFLLTEAFVTRRFPMQRQRGADAVEVRWDTPQEDEWALMMRGQPSPLLHIAFPNRPPCWDDYFDLARVSP